MDDVHRKILQEHWPTLMKNLGLLKIIEHLTEMGVLEKVDKQNMENMKDPVMASEELQQTLCGRVNKPNVFYEFLKALEKIAQEKGQPCMICILRKAEVQHWPPCSIMNLENNGAQEQCHESRNRKRNYEPVEDDYEMQKTNNNNDAGVDYDKISFDGPGHNVTSIANLHGNVQIQQLKRTVKIESHRKAKTGAEDKLKEVEQQIKEIEKGEKAASPEDMGQKTADMVQNIELMERLLSKMRACVSHAGQRIPLQKSQALDMLDNYRDKQHSSILKKTNAKGRRTHNVGRKVTKLPEIKTVQGRNIKKEETPYKRSFVYTKDFDEKGVIYHLGKIPPPGKGWENPAMKEASGNSRTGITVERTTDGRGKAFGKAEGLLEYFKPEPCGTGDKSNSWWGVDFGEKYTLLLKTYTLRHGRTDGQCMLSDWKIEGNLEGPLDSDDNWTLLREHRNEVWDSKSIPPPFMTKTWNIDFVEGPFRYFRIVQLKRKRTKNRDVRIYLAGMELYGDFYAT